MLIDLYLPQYDVRERHRTRVAAPPETVYAALRSADLAASPIVRTLFLLRALPVALARGRAGVQALLSRRATAVTLDTFESLGFRLLEALPPTELVLGIEGKFWRQTSRLCTPGAAAFLTQPPAPGTARGVWNFHLVEQPDGTTLLTTETRVRCADRGARRRFLPYWYVIRLASGIIRRAMLRSIRRAAEAASEQRRSLNAD